MNTCFKAAREYLARGWNALALCPPEHLGVGREHARACTSPGKCPLETSWKGLQKVRQTLRGLEHSWRVWPNANVGVVTGSVSGLLGIDLDGPRVQDLDEKKFPPTLEFWTGNGVRLLYALPRGVAVPSRVLDGVEVLGEGRVSVMPPSRHRSGRKYRWRNGRGLRGTLATAPPWCLEPPRSPREAVGIDDGQCIPKGRRNSTLFRIACAVRRWGCTREEILALLKEVSKRCEHSPDWRGEAELEKIAGSAMRYRPFSREE